MREYKRMHTLRRRIDGKTVKTIKQVLLAIALLFTLLPILIIFWGNLTVAPPIINILYDMFIIGVWTLTALGLTAMLFSVYSPIKSLSIRKKLSEFDRTRINSISDGILTDSVKWKYKVDGKKIIIDLYPRGLITDTAVIGKKLSQYFEENLLKYAESDYKARYILGTSPERYDGIELMCEGITESSDDCKPMISYQPIPIYDDILWDFTSEALHVLLLAPSGSGKTLFLSYLAGMVLKRQHKVYIVDAKNSQFGKLFRHSGVRVAAKTEEIIELLNKLVQEMEERYSKYFAQDTVDIDANYSSLNLEAHVLIFDEVLSALSYADKKQKAEMEKLLGQIALKGRAAGISLVITAQKLNATDLPKSITEQCQTRLILGALVSEETFHQATSLYKKELVTEYKGDVSKGYAITPKSEGLTYIETPWMPSNLRDCLKLLKDLRDRGTPNGSGC